MRPLPNWDLAVSVYRKGDLSIFNHRVFLMQRKLLKCLSRVMGNYHARVLRGRSGSNATLLPDY